MKILLQRVAQASVTVEDRSIGMIDNGYLLLFGCMRGDTEAEADWLAKKILDLRLFPGSDGRHNDRTVLEVGGRLLVVSQFTLAGRFEKGNRPDYTAAEEPGKAKELYTYFIQKLETLSQAKIATGEFGAHMQVTLQNDGPVTLLLERTPMM